MAENTESGSRWWENYAVRYFVGTAVGVVIVVVFGLFADTASYLHGVLPSKTAITGGQLGIVIGLGLAYCYISSTPILVFHATRGSWRLAGPASRPTLLLLAAMSVTFLIGLALLMVCCARGKSGDYLLGWWIIGFIATLQLAAIGATFRKGLSKTEAFYKDLLEARQLDSKETGIRRGYVESYRHLREHGNAVLIVILEVVLGLSLALLDSLSQLVAAVVVWLLPAAAVWPIGTILEAKFADRKGDWGEVP